MYRLIFIRASDTWKQQMSQIYIQWCRYRCTDLEYNTTVHEFIHISIYIRIDIYVWIRVHMYVYTYIGFCGVLVFGCCDLPVSYAWAVWLLRFAPQSSAPLLAQCCNHLPYSFCVFLELLGLWLRVVLPGCGGFTLGLSSSPSAHLAPWSRLQLIWLWAFWNSDT